MRPYIRVLGAGLIAILISIYLAGQILISANHAPGLLIQYPDAHSIKSTYPHHKQNITIKPPLSTKGRYIVDRDGDRVKLLSVNWYGASDELFVVGGLDVRHRDDIANTIKKLGFNSVRLPYSDQMVIENPMIASSLLTANPDLMDQRALDIYSAVVESLTTAGLMVIPNNHITTARWCCDANLCDGTWYNSYLPSPFCTVHQTQQSWIAHILTIMQPHIDNPLVIGVDLRNEVRAIADRLIWSDWASAAEAASERLLAMQPNWLMIVEGVSSANILSGARSRPVRLSVPNKLVYSAHVYGWSGWGSLQPYWNRNYMSFAADMYAHWAWLMMEDIAPVWVGEFGAPGENPNRGDVNYWRNLVRFLDEVDADWGYWALNPRKPRGDAVEGYGLLHDDWESVRWDWRMWDLGRLMKTRERP